VADPLAWEQGSAPRRLPATDVAVAGGLRYGDVLKIPARRGPLGCCPPRAPPLRARSRHVRTHKTGNGGSCSGTQWRVAKLPRTE
jgi:hypothetical protein